MIHRAPFGSMERFCGVLIKHFGGDFPVWLAPEQVRLVPISDKVLDYGHEVLSHLKAAGVRATLDEHGDRWGRRSAGAPEKIPYTLVLGAKEAESKAASVRSRQGRRRGDALCRLHGARRQRNSQPSPPVQSPASLLTREMPWKLDSTPWWGRGGQLCPLSARLQDLAAHARWRRSHYQLAWTHAILDHPREALPHYQQSIACGLPPDQLSGAYIGLGGCWREIGNLARWRCCAAALRCFPRTPSFGCFWR